MNKRKAKKIAAQWCATTIKNRVTALDVNALNGAEEIATSHDVQRVRDAAIEIAEQILARHNVEKEAMQ